MENVYRRFVKDLSIIAAPLRELTKKDTKFAWTKDCQDAFTMIKERLTNSPIVCQPDWAKTFEIFCDGSKQGLGYALTQEGKIIYYRGRALKPADWTGRNQKKSV